MDKIVNVITTTDGVDLLDKIGATLLDARLISCIQIVGPIKSAYRWKGRVEIAEEWMGIMKTRRGLYGRVREEIRRMHPYETPQIEIFEVADALPAYRQWVMEETAAE